MSVVFEEEKNNGESGLPSGHFTSRKIFGEPAAPRMAQFLRTTGVVKTERQAGYILMLICVVSIALSLWLLRSEILPAAPYRPPTVYYEDIAPDMRAKLPQGFLNTLPHHNAQ